MMIASGEKGGACGRAERSGVEARKTETGFGEAIEVGCRHLSTEGSPLAEARVVDQNHEDVRHTLGRSDESNLVRLRVFVGGADDAFEFGRRLRQNILAGLTSV